MKSKTIGKTLVSGIAFFGVAVAAFGQGEPASLSLADELERAIYLQEGEANLDAAAHAYQKILTESELVDSIAAEARYRLAAVYLEQGKKALGLTLLDELVKKYPGEQKWVDEAKQLLPQTFVPEITPWHDGERTHLDWRLPSGDLIGKSFSTIFRFEWEGRELWRKETRYLLNGNRAIAVEFEPETFDTIYSDMSLDEMGSIRTWYADDGLSAKVEYAKSGATRNFDFQQRVYDNEQAHELMRQMPIELGYSMVKPIFVSVSGMPIDITFEISRIEKMDTALGEVECYEVTIDLFSQKQYATFTADERRLPVKFSAGGIEGVLTGVDTVDFGAERSYRNETHGYEIEIPATWEVIPQFKGNNEDNQLVWLVQPMARGTYLLASERNDAWSEDVPLSLESLVKNAEKKVKGGRSGATLDTDWGRDLSVGPLQGRVFRLVGEGEGSARKLIYLYALLGAERYYVFQGHILEGDEEEMLPKLEAIVATLSETR